MVVFNVLLKLISKIFALALLVILSIIDCLFSVLAICGVLVGNVLKYLTGFYFLLVIFGQGGDKNLIIVLYHHKIKKDNIVIRYN